MAAYILKSVQAEMSKAAGHRVY